MLAVTGGVAGVAIAFVTLDRLGQFAARALPGYVTLSLDWGAVLVTGAIAIATGLLFGAAPATVHRALAGDRAPLRDDSRGASESRRSLRLRGVLVAGQMALCLSLLVGAGLLARSLWAMTGQSLGFEPDGVLTAALQLPLRDYATPESRALFRTRLEEELRGLPGVTAVATATSIPTAVRQRSGVTLEGAPSTGGPTFVITAAVSDDYFRTLQIPLHRGRTFGTQDLPNTPTKLVISESMARRFWPDGNAIGQRVRLGPNAQAPLNEIVGIVGDVRNDRARPDAEPMAYASTRQIGAPIVTILVRADGDPLALARPMERAVAGARFRNRAAASDDTACRARRRHRRPPASGPPDDWLRRIGAAARVGGRLRHVRQPRRRTRA